MKRQLILLLTLSLLLITPHSSFAQTDDNEVAETTTEESSMSKVRSELFHVGKDFTQIKNEIKAKRMEAIEEMKSAREEFKLKLQSISDARKKKAVENIDTKLNNANQRHTDKLTGNLEKLSSVLERISSKAASLKSEGKDTTAVDAAIEDAESKIEEAEAAITTQAGKEYVITIDDETNLGQTISPIIAQFRTDIKTAYQAVMDARSSVVNAARLLKTTAESVSPTPTI